MTIAEFFDALKQEAPHGRWFLTNLWSSSRKPMRVAYNGYCHCPITFVAAVRGGPVVAARHFQQAAKWLGMSESDAQTIVDVVDGVSPKASERQLLQTALTGIHIAPNQFSDEQDAS